MCCRMWKCRVILPLNFSHQNQKMNSLGWVGTFISTLTKVITRGWNWVKAPADNSRWDEWAPFLHVTWPRTTWKPHIKDTFFFTPLESLESPIGLRKRIFTKKKKKREKKNWKKEPKTQPLLAPHNHSTFKYRTPCDYSTLYRKSFSNTRQKP